MNGNTAVIISALLLEGLGITGIRIQGVGNRILAVRTRSSNRWASLEGRVP